MLKSKKKQLQLGIFVVAGLLIFVLAVYYLGKQENIFGSGITVYAEFSNAKGLKPGNNVRFLGTSAGYVSGVTVKNDSVIVIAIVVSYDMSRYIRKNATVEIQNEGVMGSKILEIKPGSGDAGIIQDNDLLPSGNTLSIEEVFSALETTVENSIKASENLWLITERIKNGEGALGKFINDTNMNQTIDDIAANVRAITTDAKLLMDKTINDENDIGRFLNDDHFTQKLEGTFVQMDSVMENMQSISHEILKATEAINEGEGVFNKLLYDRNFAIETDTTLSKINNAVDNVSETTDVIKRSWIFNLFSRD
jgi:phospholipid/cholesterol/gamma-HCH transport system substrate-binding protein